MTVRETPENGREEAENLSNPASRKEEAGFARGSEEREAGEREREKDILRSFSPSLPLSPMKPVWRVQYPSLLLSPTNHHNHPKCRCVCVELSIFNIFLSLGAVSVSLSGDSHERKTVSGALSRITAKKAVRKNRYTTHHCTAVSIQGQPGPQYTPQANNNIMIHTDRQTTVMAFFRRGDCTSVYGFVR